MTSPHERAFDRGLQPERTALSWQRTLLALGAALIAASRALLELLGVVSYVLAGLGLVAVAVLYVITRRRYRSVHRHLTMVDARSLPSGGRLVFACAAITLCCGAGALVFVVVRLL